MKDLSKIFDDMTKEELINFFNDCDIQVEEVPEGQGGFYLDEERFDFKNNK
jgi:hypothetical protein